MFSDFRTLLIFAPFSNDIDDAAFYPEGHYLKIRFSQTSVFTSVVFTVAVPLLSFLIAPCTPAPSPSLVRRLHPGKHWHHPFARVPGLLPTQPELHVDNRDLPWQR